MKAIGRLKVVASAKAITGAKGMALMPGSSAMKVESGKVITMTVALTRMDVSRFVSRKKPNITPAVPNGLNTLNEYSVVVSETPGFIVAVQRARERVRMMIRLKSMLLATSLGETIFNRGINKTRVSRDVKSLMNPNAAALVANTQPPIKFTIG